MLDTFINNSEDAIETFERLLKEKNWVQIGETAHRLLPSYRHLKIDSVIENLVNLKTLTLIEPDFRYRINF